MVDFTGPIFIVGMPRSGTKLIRSILNNHPKITIPIFETEFLPYWVKHWGNYGDLRAPGTFGRFYKTVIKSSFFHYTEQNSKNVISEEKWRNACERGTVADVFETLIRLHTGCERDMIWGDKSPSYIRHIPMLMDLFPDGKIIHIVRDVRDYCLSMNGAWGKNMLRAAQRWADDVGSARIAISMHSKSAIEVRFEDLLENPQGQLQIICDFIGIKYEENILVSDKATENIGAAKGMKKIVTDNKEKWRSKMDLSMVREIEKISGKILDAYNFPITYHGPSTRVSSLKMLLLQLLDGFNLVFHDTEKRGVVKNIIFYMRSLKFSGNRQ